ncbi:hypothetical protein EZV62_001736 [Acer yangbiense]|uniref:Vta1/callose synthase N-terminal domain-containing protein n=1 Tax=Acer yangbiense TaxID=1000413 RepID=A0A5C7IUZ5_9ROSI|nr:hypothetical protein EZV62_001736 [Acer yangbiense]
MSSSRGGSGADQPSLQPPPTRRITWTQTVGNLRESLFNSMVVPSSLAELERILRVANEVESINPTVAYLCRFYAFEEAYRLDPNPTRRGVRQFRTALLQRLERDNDPTLLSRRSTSDAREMQSFYEHSCTSECQTKTESTQEDFKMLPRELGAKSESSDSGGECDTEAEKLQNEEQFYSLSPPPPRSPPIPYPVLSRGGEGSVFDSEVVPSSFIKIAPILQLVNEVESSNPRVAYLCNLFGNHFLLLISMAQLVKGYQTANVLYEVLKAMEVDHLEVKQYQKKSKRSFQEKLKQSLRA